MTQDVRMTRETPVRHPVREAPRLLVDSSLPLVYPFTMSFPIKVNASTRLKVEIHLHEFFLGDRIRQCWTYITTGLAQYDQHEMCLSLLLEDGDRADEFPRTPVRIFQLLEKHAAEGRIVDIADATKLGKRGFFGFEALYFLPAIQYDGLPCLDQHLALILVHQAEHDFAKRYGFTRLMTRMGKFCSTFPYPTWNTRKRPSLFVEGHREDTVLNHAHVIQAHGLLASLNGDIVELSVEQSLNDEALVCLGEITRDRPVVFQTGLSLDASACLCWEPGQENTGAYTAPDGVNRISSAFILFEPASVQVGSILEDGFAFTLSDISVKSLLNTFRTRGKCDLPDFHGLKLTIRHCAGNEPTVSAPAYRHLAGWKELHVRKRKVSRVEVKDVSTNARNRVASGQLGEYVNAVESFLETTLADESDHFTLTIRVVLARQQTRYEVMADIELNPDFIEFIQAGLRNIKPCYTSSPLTFDLVFEVNA